LLDDESGGFELDAGGSFVVAEDVAEGLVGLVDQSHDSFAVHQIALGESLLQGGGEMRKLAAPGENILAENVGYGDGAVDGATGADHIASVRGRGAWDRRGGWEAMKGKG
jgi:hypothetical protein